jgi:beta-lactam-binding protein with PASTA domain
MSRVFAITSATNEVLLNPDAKGEATFTVTNSSARSIRAQIKVRPLEEGKIEWLSIVGETERDFTPGSTQQVLVKVQIPTATPAAKYSFRVDVISVENPDEDYSEGPVVALRIGLPPRPVRPFPWWILIVVSASLVLISGLIYFLIPKNVVVPVVMNLPFGKAEELVRARGLIIEKQSKEDPDAKEELVIDQDPKEGSIKKGGIIKLTVTVPVPLFKMPDFKGAGTNIKEAEEFFSKKYVKLEKTPTENDNQAEGKILDQAPDKDAEVGVGDTITLTFAVPVRPFPMPDITGKNWAAAKSELENKGLRVIFTEKIDPGRQHESVVEQVPPINTPVKSGDQVTLTIAITLVNVPTNTVGRDWKTARTILQEAGLRLSEVRGDCSKLVEDTNPKGGLPVRKGSSVVLFTQGDRGKVCYRPSFLLDTVFRGDKLLRRDQ